MCSLLISYDCNTPNTYSARYDIFLHRMRIRNRAASTVFKKTPPSAGGREKLPYSVRIILELNFAALFSRTPSCRLYRTNSPEEFLRDTGKRVSRPVAYWIFGEESAAYTLLVHRFNISVLLTPLDCITRNGGTNITKIVFFFMMSHWGIGSFWSSCRLCIIILRQTTITLSVFYARHSLRPIFSSISPDTKYIRI